MALLEVLFGFTNLGSLPMADIGRETLDARGQDAERRDVGRMTIARDDLRRGRFGPESEGVERFGLDARREVCVGPDGAGDLTDGNFVARHLEPLSPAGELGVVAGQDQSKGGRLGVDAVRAADRRGTSMLLDAAAQRLEHRI